MQKQRGLRWSGWLRLASVAGAVVVLSWHSSSVLADGCDPYWEKSGEVPPDYEWECYDANPGGAEAYGLRPKPIDGEYTLEQQNPCEGETEEPKSCVLSYTVAGPTLNSAGDEIYTLTPTDSCGTDGIPFELTAPPACSCYETGV